MDRGHRITCPEHSQQTKPSEPDSTTLAQTGKPREEVISGNESDQDFYSTIKLTKVNERAFSGEQVNTPKISKQEAGKIGEAVILEYLRSQGFTDAIPSNTKKNNFPVDINYDHELVEVKTGQASNGHSAHQWRLTIG